jgi:large subunit ribosomal protein L2
VRHRGGGAKRLLRKVDWKGDKFDISGRVERIEVDPQRNVFLTLVTYADGEKRYLLAWEGIRVGQEVVSSLKRVPLRPGNRMPLHYIPAGTAVHNVALAPGRSGRIARSAGGGAIVLDVGEKYVQLRLPSGELRLVPRDALATIGVPLARGPRVKLRKAGDKRRRGIRPTVRGKAMNPVDHPHGGGEGGSPIGLKHPKTKWGKPARGVLTRRKGKWSNRLIIKRRRGKQQKNK